MPQGGGIFNLIELFPNKPMSQLLNDLLSAMV